MSPKGVSEMALLSLVEAMVASRELERGYGGCGSKKTAAFALPEGEWVPPGESLRRRPLADRGNGKCFRRPTGNSDER